MTTKQDAIKLALEALKVNHEWHIVTDDHDGYPDSELCNQNTKAIAALSAISEQPVQDGDALRKLVRFDVIDGKLQSVPSGDLVFFDRVKELFQSAQPSDKTCTSCPHSVGDAYQRDCAYPDCLQAVAPAQAMPDQYCYKHDGSEPEKEKSCRYCRALKAAPQPYQEQSHYDARTKNQTTST